MGKKVSGVSQTMSRFRGWIQAGATLLTNLHLPNFLKGALIQSALEEVRQMQVGQQRRSRLDPAPEAGHGL